MSDIVEAPNVTVGNSLNSAKTSAARLIGLDSFRGFIMILMAIDHTSYFIAKIHSREFWGTRLPHYPGSVAFLTRWVTHLCAPGFFFLMGIGVVFFATSRERAGWSHWKITRFLMIRGTVLILIQFFIENRAWMLGYLSALPGVAVTRGGPVPGGGSPASTYYGVLFALGGALILCSLLFRLRTIKIAAIGGAVLALTQIAVLLSVPTAYRSIVTTMFLIPGHANSALVYFPILPWFAISCLGMAFGRNLQRNGRDAYRQAAYMGACCLVFFVLFRLLAGWSDFHPVGPGWIGFLNVTKYPPSLEYVLATFAINLPLLAFFGLAPENWSVLRRILVPFGQCALLFYVVHLYIYGLIGFAFPRGSSISVMYSVWLAGLFILYPLCLGYGRFKKTRPLESIWRLF
ncbi:MAG: DUF1624 domain-containing protein [Syntrophobacteraceae bacterium]